MKNVVEVKTRAGHTFLIDAVDSDWLSIFSWCSKTSKARPKHIYAKTSYKKENGERGYISLHRLIMGAPDRNIHVDHINGNTLDNRKANLRLCSPSGNASNRVKKFNSKSIYKGLSYRERSGKYEVSVTKNGKAFYVGSFYSEIEAKKAYDKKSKEIHGEFSLTRRIL